MCPVWSRAKYRMPDKPGAIGSANEKNSVSELVSLHASGSTTVPVPLPVGLGAGGTGIDRACVQTAFDRAYRTAFSRLLPGIAVRIVNLRTAAIGRRPAFDSPGNS